MALNRKYARRRGSEGNNLSFLDVISSGFGAIVLLLVIVKTAEPSVLVERQRDLAARLFELSTRLPALDEQIGQLQARLGDRQSELMATRRQIAAIEPPATARASQIAERALDLRASRTLADRLEVARQSLTEEMRRLLGEDFRRSDDTVGGIPVDSEYIIFVIDTSGSMQRVWPRVIAKLEETLSVYPRVRGVQIFSDMGEYMFSQTAGQWIPDTPGRRRAIISRMQSWRPFSNSSPVEGITSAIRALADPNRRISIFVFGDEFTGRAIQPVIDTVSRMNPVDERGEPMIRIHALGFPTQSLGGSGMSATGVRFALLMRELTRANNGTFVALQ